MSNPEEFSNADDVLGPDRKYNISPVSHYTAYYSDDERDYGKQVPQEAEEEAEENIYDEAPVKGNSTAHDADVRERSLVDVNGDPVSVPASPSLTQDPSLANSPDIMKPASAKDPAKDKKKEFVRKENGEEHACFFNIFYCFFFPFVCRVAPLEDADIPAVAVEDDSDANYVRISKYWDPAWAAYSPLKDEWDEKKKQNPDLTEKEPKPPGILGLTIKSLWSPLLTWGMLLLALSVAFNLIQPWLMRQIVIVVMNKMMVEDVVPELIMSMVPPGTFPSEKDIPQELIDSTVKRVCEEQGIDYVKNIGFPYALAILIMICPFGFGFLDANGFRLMFHMSSNIRSAFCALIYGKTLRLNINSQSNINTGRLLSLMSSDARMVADMIPMLMSFIWLPVQILVPLIFCFYYFEVATFVALGVVIVVFPIQGVLGGMFANYMRDYMFYNDERNKLTNETLQGVRVVKYSGLEAVFSKRIVDVREMQISATIKMTISMQCIMAMMRSLPSFVNAFTFQTFITWKNINQLAFTVQVQPILAYLQQMTQPLAMMAVMIQSFSMISVSSGRIRDFLILPELKQEEKVAPEDAQVAISIKDGTFKWGDPPVIPLTAAEKQAIEKEVAKQKKLLKSGKAPPISPSPNSSSSPTGKEPPPPGEGAPSPTPTPSVSPSTAARRALPTLRNISFEVPKGSLTMVIGGVGSGKSSIGSALIGDIERKSGDVRIAGSFAYCPQVAWINNNTVRGNIIFGMPYDEKKYMDVVRLCALEPDFRTLAAGDQTAIGEKGVNLSGGQKARIQLARSVYANRDIYILDDPLSAVDAHVGRYLFEECICGVLQDKTRLLMTNQLQYLERADNIILMSDGEIIHQGTYQELQEKGVDFSQYIFKSNDEKENEESANSEDGGEEGQKKRSKHKETKSKKKQQTGVTNIKDLEGSADSAATQIVTEEEQSTSGVAWSTYFRYILSLLPWYFAIPYLLLTVLGEGITSFQSYWLGRIGDDAEFSDVNYNWKRWIYLFFGIGVLLIIIIRAFCTGFAVGRSNRIVHNDLLHHVLHCPPSFFDQTPLGRLINRFSGDMNLTDSWLNMMFLMVMQLWLQIIGQVVVVAIDTAWFLAIGGPILLVYYLMLIIYSRASRNLQRLESISRSPVLSLFGETVSGAGLSTIRAYHLEEEWRKRFYLLSDDWSIRFILFKEGTKWVSMITSLVSSMFMVGVIILGWFLMKPQHLVVAMTSAMMFGFLGVFLVQQNVELESRMTSMERIFFYSDKLPQELENPKVEPPTGWPSHGQVVFDNVSFRYRPGLPYVLRDVSFTFRGGEKIGVCGRTGAGKTSLLFALFRLIELDPKLAPLMIDMDTGFPIENKFDEPPNRGRVLIDDIDISQIKLNQLRQAIAIIPQDPTLFTGTIRYNVDLASRCADDKIWEVLEMIQMKDAILDLSQGLDTQVAEGGSNFSCGQRQLLCFARAILNNCRIVIMDEATASVDVETDAKIQQTIKIQFKDQTVIVIAHRLNTIITSDKILVMDAGHVAEFDTPENLQNDPNSAFNGLLHSLTE